MLFQALCEEFEDEGCLALVATIDKHLTETEKVQFGGNQNYWKLAEAIMVSLGTVQETLMCQVKLGKVKFDLTSFLQLVVMPGIQTPGKNVEK